MSSSRVTFSWSRLETLRLRCPERASRMARLYWDECVLGWTGDCLVLESSMMIGTYLFGRDRKWSQIDCFLACDDPA